MGFLMSIRRSLGLPKDDGGFSSALWNIGQIERYGSIVDEQPYEVVEAVTAEDRERLDHPDAPAGQPRD